MIVDVSAFFGHWASLPADAGAEAVRNSLKAVGVDAMFFSLLDSVWASDPNRANGVVYWVAERFPDVYPVPVLDPTIASWRRELARAAAEPKVRLARLLPNYGYYELARVDDLLAALSESGMAALIQTRMEDPRAHHPRAQVPDLPAAAAASVAERHPKLTVIIGGARTGEIRALGDQLRSLPNLYADVSQADGMNALRGLVAEGLAPKLLFGSHAPLFVPRSAMARVLTDLDDADAEAILGGNAARLFGL